MDYMTALGLGFSGVEAHVVGDATIYENIIWDGGLPLPSKSTLDSWIASNQPQSSSKITVLALRNRFTLIEKTTIELASIDNPNEQLADRQEAAMIRVMLADLAAASYIDLTSAELAASLNFLEQSGLIGQGRANEIISAPVIEIEQVPEAHVSL
jgi:hypothetical protein